MTTTSSSDLLARARRLGLHGLCARWDELGSSPWIKDLLDCEDAERQRRSLERRVHSAHLGRFRPLCDFDWTWPRRIDRDVIDDIYTLGFIEDAENILIIGPNGVGKTMLAQNIAHHALLHGHTVLFTSASALLADLTQRDSAHLLQLRLRRYARPKLLVIDELGYLSYDHRHADLLFEVISRRYLKLPTMITTNKPFSEWNDVFPNATSVVTLIDRLTHRAELIQIDADSFRLKEAKERSADKAKRRTARRKSKPS
jgi:DNA replication protein DnaC